MFYVYILYSQKCNRHYIGYSADPIKRLNERHNLGRVKATKNCIPYVLKKMKIFTTETEARKEEYKIKKMKSTKYIEQLIVTNW